MERPPAWALPFIVLALALPIIVGFSVGGPGVGLGIGALAIFAIVVVAARSKPRLTIETARSRDGKRRILVVTTQDLDEPTTTERIAAAADLHDDEETEIVVLAPARAAFLDRWASDERAARADAQRVLVLGAASLGKADVPVRARVGDADVVLAVEDELRTFAATELILVTGRPNTDPAGERAAAELAERIRQPLTRLTVG